MKEKFACIVADPPWHVKAGPNGGGYSTVEGVMKKWNWRAESLQSRPLAYPAMSVEEICALPVAGVAADDAHLYLWTINRYVREAYDVARAWDFKPSTLLTWAKKPMGGGAWRRVWNLDRIHSFCTTRSPEGEDAHQGNMVPVET